MNQMSLESLRKFALRRGQDIMIASEMSRSSSYEDAVEGDRRLAELGVNVPSVKPKPAPYVNMKDRPEVVAVGKEYDEMLRAKAEQGKCETRMAYLEKLKKMTPHQEEEYLQVVGTAEEWQAVSEKFFEKHPGKWVGHPELVAARRAYLQKRKEAN